MFWRVSGLNTASPVDSILDKESYTLEELLDEDELIQECKSLNVRLTAYLKQKETVEKLVRYLVELPPPGADPKRSFKYPFTACEVFCCEVEGIFNTLLEHEDVLASLFSLLEAPRPLNCMLAGYFSRVMGSLLLRRTQDVMQYLQRHQALLLQLVEHVDTTSIAEVLVRLVGADEQRTFLSTNHLQWLSDTNLLYLLLDKLQAGQPVEAQSNAAEILAALAQSQVSPLTRNLADPTFLELLVERALRQPDAAGGGADGGVPGLTNRDGKEDAEGGAAEGKDEGKEEKAGTAAGAGVAASEGAGDSSGGGGASSSAMMHARVHALNVCIALVEPLLPSLAEQQAVAQGLGLGAMPPPAIDVAAAELHAVMRAQATQCIAKSIHRLVALLEAADPDRRLPTSYGLLHPPVGLARLKAVELLAALLHSGDEAAESAVMGTRGVQRSMELFLAFPFNNVLHRHVAALVTALDQGSERLAAFLVQDCRLLQWLVAAPTEVTPLAQPGDKPANQRRPLRTGYAGHVTQISNRLIQVANEGQQQLRAAMEGDAEWQAYVKERLEPRNAQENVFAWKCGRPTVHEPVVDAEADMFQTELDFGSVESEAFSRDVYQRYGVFSSHEDEEVDTEQPQWAMELANATSVAGIMSAPPALGPQPFPVYDSSSSSSSSDDDSSDDDASGTSSEEGEVSVTPAPEDDMLLVNSTGGRTDGADAAATPAARLPRGSDDADMADDAVMLEYDAAEQLVSLLQLSLEDNDGGDGGGCVSGDGTAQGMGGAEQPGREPGTDTNAPQEQQQGLTTGSSNAAVVAGEAGKASGQQPAEAAPAAAAVVS